MMTTTKHPELFFRKPNSISFGQQTKQVSSLAPRAHRAPPAASSPLSSTRLRPRAYLAMCGGCCRRQRGPDGTPVGRRWGCGTVLAVLALAVAAAVAFLESTAGGVSYAGDGWIHECAKWDAEGGRFLLSNFYGAGVSEVRAGEAEERVVFADPDAAGRVTLGLKIDAPRRRLLLVYADRVPRFGYAALGAYELGSWRRLFLTRLDVPGDYTLPDDVAADEEGNAYVTDAFGSKIWKVSPDGVLLGVIKNSTFTQRPGRSNNMIALNGILYHPNGYLLVVHTSGGDLFKVDPKAETVRVVKLQGSLSSSDGIELLSPTRMVVAAVPNVMVESSDDWETARVTGQYFGPVHRIPSTPTVKDGDVYINYVFGLGLGKKKTRVIARAVFTPVAAAS